MAVPAGRLQFREIAQALLHTQGLRLTAEYEYKTLAHAAERTTFLCVSTAGDDIRVIALPSRDMELQQGMGLQLQGKNIPIVPSSVIRSLSLGVLSEAGASDPVIAAARRLLTPRTDAGLADSQGVRDDMSMASRGLMLIADAENRRGLERLLDNARRGKYVPFAFIREGVSPGAYCELTYSRRRFEHLQPRQLVAVATIGQFSASQDLQLGGDYSSHIYIAPPPGSVLTSCEFPQHWPSGAATGRTRGNVWHAYADAHGKRRIKRARRKLGVSRGSARHQATFQFATSITPHAALCLGFLLLTFAPFALTIRDDHDNSAQRMLPVFALVGTLILPVIWASRDAEIQLIYLVSNGVVMLTLALLWLVFAGHTPPLLVWSGILLAGREFVLVACAFQETYKNDKRDSDST